MLLLLIFAVTVGSQKAHEYYSEYSEFMIFNQCRAAVIDHPVLRDQIWNDEIQPGTQLFYFSSWIFDDNGFSNQELIEQKSKLDLQIFSFTHAVRTVYRTYFYLKTSKIKLLLILIFSGLYFWFLPPSWKKYAFYWLWLIFFYLANLFLVLQTRVNFFFFLFTLFPVFFHENILRKKVSNSISHLVLGLSLIHFFHFIIIDLKYQKLEKQLLDIFSDQVSHQLIFLEDLPLERFKSLYLKPPQNLLVLGWVARSPFQEKFYINNHLKDLKSVRSLAVVTFQGENYGLLRGFLKWIDTEQIQVVKTRSTQDFIKITYQISHYLR